MLPGARELPGLAVVLFPGGLIRRALGINVAIPVAASLVAREALGRCDEVTAPSPDTAMLHGAVLPRVCGVRLYAALYPDLLTLHALTVDLRTAPGEFLDLLHWPVLVGAARVVGTVAMLTQALGLSEQRMAAALVLLLALLVHTVGVRRHLLRVAFLPRIVHDAVSVSLRTIARQASKLTILPRHSAAWRATARPRRRRLLAALVAMLSLMGPTAACSAQRFERHGPTCHVARPQ